MDLTTVGWAGHMVPVTGGSQSSPEMEPRGLFLQAQNKHRLALPFSWTAHSDSPGREEASAGRRGGRNGILSSNNRGKKNGVWEDNDSEFEA